jgi:outer membrane protein assembly factor BamB
MFWTTAEGGGVFNVLNTIYGWDFPSDFQKNATLLGQWLIQTALEAVDFQYGKIFCGSGYGSAMCLDGKTGALLWKHQFQALGYNGAFYDGIWVAAGQDGVMYGFNTTNGDIMWTFYPPKASTASGKTQAA